MMVRKLVTMGLFGLLMGGWMVGVLKAEMPLPSAASKLEAAVVAEGNLARFREFFRKAADGGPLVVGVLGGSITEGAVCPTREKRYANVMLSWLAKTFPQATFTLVNAGVGATGSNYGALRLQRDLLIRKPDLVVLEYAVNDSNDKFDAETYEGVVRQILASPGRPALLLLFTMRKDGSNAQEWEAKVGRHYQVPMLSYRDALWPEIQAGRLQWHQISPDLTHPNEAGHVWLGELIGSFLARVRKSVEASKTDLTVASSTKLPAPLLSSRFDHCTIFEGTTLKPTHNRGWTFQGTTRRNSGWESAEPGSVIEFEVEGETIFVSWWRIRGPMGVIALRVDHGKPVRLDGWFEKTWGGYKQTLLVAKGLKPGRHTVTIELLQEKNPGSTGHQFRLMALGTAGVAVE